jgi:holliday junction DNA helicase RuvA
MIFYLIGKITDKEIESLKTFIVLEVASIGYQIFCNQKTANKLRIGTEEKIFIYQLLREDGEKLFGFLDKESLDLFEVLISVSGIGPRNALGLLDTLEKNELVSAVINDQAKLIATAPGIGEKIAKKIILELKNKLKKFLPIASKLSSAGSSDYSSGDETRSTLKNLGFSDLEIEKALVKAREEGIEDNEEAIIKFALRNI